MKHPSMTVERAMRLMKASDYADLARKLHIQRQNIDYWRRAGIPHWWIEVIRSRSNGLR